MELVLSETIGATPVNGLNELCIWHRVDANQLKFRDWLLPTENGSIVDEESVSNNNLGLSGHLHNSNGLRLTEQQLGAR